LYARRSGGLGETVKDGFELDGLAGEIKRECGTNGELQRAFESVARQQA
jgi:hypothetical protein